MMQDPIVRHSYVQLNGSFVHLVQYGLCPSIIKSPSNTIESTNSLSSIRDSRSYSVKSTDSWKENVDYDFNNQANQFIPFEPKKIIIFIPGNPGLLGIYHDFLISLFRMISNKAGGDNESSISRGNHKSTKAKTDNYPIILAMSHNNFDHPDHVDYKSEERICLDENDFNFVERALAKNHQGEPHHIELQVLNKLIILKKLLKFDIDDSKLVFIGHSIGCYVILRLLQDKLIASSHEGSVLIHPALENLALTIKGSKINSLFNYKLDLIVQSVSIILDNLLPKSAKLTLAKWFCSQEFVEGSSEIAVDSVTQLVCRNTMTALIQMAKSELATVKNLNTESMIKPHVSKLKLIYAINDLWVNTDNRKFLRELFPDLYMEEQPTLHAFIMDPQTVMDYAFKVGMFVQDFLDNNDQKES